MSTTRLYITLAFGFLWLLFLAWIFASDANSQEHICRYVRQTYPAWDSWQGIVVTRERWVRRCYRNHTYYLPEDAPTRVYGYTRRDDDDHRYGRNCRDRLKIVGDQHVSVDGAKGAADKAWSQTVRFYHGERFMDVANASGASYTCSRSSVGETLGQTFTRCELEARPCAPQKQESGR